jgi:hypothetical protein
MSFNSSLRRGALGTPGTSSWAGESDVNSHSIGIELANPGHDHGYPDFPKRQIAAVTALCRSIFTRHRIAADRVLAHSDVAPARKRDPARSFHGRRWPIRASGSGSSPRRSSQPIQSSRSATPIPPLRRRRPCWQTMATTSPRQAIWTAPRATRWQAFNVISARSGSTVRRQLDHRDAQEPYRRARCAPPGEQAQRRLTRAVPPQYLARP